MPLLFVTVPWLLLDETYWTPAGSVSERVTPVAPEGPLLVVVKV